MKNFVRPGETIAYTNNSGSAIASGDGVLIGKRLGAATDAIANGATGELRVRGVVSLPKKAGDTPAQGDLLYWDNTAKNLTTTATSNTQAGYAAAAAAGADATVNVHLNA